ncbi:hypothetical protein LINPERPRIM_LOCUS19248 [Linum perenne]
MFLEVCQRVRRQRGALETVPREIVQVICQRHCLLFLQL